MTKIMPNFLSKLSTVLAFTLGAGAVMGILGGMDTINAYE
jgi:hypothetical protein